MGQQYLLSTASVQSMVEKLRAFAPRIRALGDAVGVVRLHDTTSSQAAMYLGYNSLTHTLEFAPSLGDADASRLMEYVRKHAELQASNPGYEIQIFNLLYSYTADELGRNAALALDLLERNSRQIARLGSRLRMVRLEKFNGGLPPTVWRHMYNDGVLTIRAVETSTRKAAPDDSIAICVNQILSSTASFIECP